MFRISHFSFRKDREQVDANLLSDTFFSSHAFPKHPLSLIPLLKVKTLLMPKRSENKNEGERKRKSDTNREGAMSQGCDPKE